MNKKQKIFLNAIKKEDFIVLEEFLNENDFNPVFLCGMALIEALKYNKKNIVNLFHKSKRFDLIFKDGRSPAFSDALIYGDLEILNLFLENKDIEIFAKKESPLVMSLHNLNPLIFQTLINRTKTENNIKINYNRVLNEFIYLANKEHLEIILKEKKFNILYDNYKFLFDLLFVSKYDHKKNINPLNEKKEIMEILLQDERYNFINYNEIKNLLNIEKKNNKFNLYSKIYKIEKLRKPLLDYINLKEEDKEYIKMIKLNEF